MRDDLSADGHASAHLTIESRPIVDDDLSRALLNGYEVSFYGNDRSRDALMSIHHPPGAIAVRNPGIVMPRAAA